MPRLQPVSLHVLQYGDEEGFNGAGKGFQLRIEGVAPQLFVDVSDEVDEALLVPTLYEIKAGVKIRPHPPFLALKNLMHDARLSGRRHSEDDVSAVREDPNVMVFPLDVDL